MSLPSAACSKSAQQMADLNIRDAKILEAGCGTGWLSAKLSEFGKVTAVDIGEKIIEIAQETYPHIDFRSGDIETLDLPVNFLMWSSLRRSWHTLPTSRVLCTGWRNFLSRVDS